MLIRRIKSIKDFGVYQDFKWRGDTPDFENKNIIYGWNYSGKTTLSRFFDLLPDIEEEQAKRVGYKVTVCDDKGCRTDFETGISALSIRVFNSDYIEQNLHFEKTDNPKIKGILFDIGEATNEKRQKLNDVKRQIDAINAWLLSNHNHIDAFELFDKIFTSEARIIKNDIFLSAIEFNRTHFKKIIEELDLTKLDAYIISDSNELNEIKSNALAKNPMATIEYAPISFDIQSLINEVNELLIYSPVEVKDEPLLSSSSELYQWGLTGLKYYSQNPHVSICAFCGNPIKPHRIDELNRFYSNEAARLRTRINNLIHRLNALSEEISYQKNITISTNDIIESLRIKFDVKKAALVKSISEIGNVLNSIISNLNSKIDSYLFEKMPALDFPKNIWEEYQSCVKDLLSIIRIHNSTVADFKSVKDKAISDLKKHCVARVLKEREYTAARRRKERQEREIQERNRELTQLKSLFESLQAELKSLSKGKDNLNRFIQLFLGREDLEIHTTEDNFFILKRGNAIATRLSEGEKTAIALSYFLVNLESLKADGELKKSIIFIDDPISSLDANHIAQVSSLINSFFFIPNGNSVIDNFAQLFICTHNFEFFSFIKDAHNIKRNNNSSQCRIFMLQRKSERCVEITKLPNTFDKYNSEYLFLFSEIYKYYKAGCPIEMSYMMPNVIRRFLEIYTRIKLPGNHDEIDNRVRRLMKDGVNELKILHHFSHFTSLERVTKHSEIILQLPDITADLFKLLQKDQDHLNSLIEGI